MPFTLCLHYTCPDHHYLMWQMYRKLTDPLYIRRLKYLPHIEWNGVEYIIQDAESFVLVSWPTADLPSPEILFVYDAIVWIETKPIQEVYKHFSHRPLAMKAAA